MHCLKNTSPLVFYNPFVYSKNVSECIKRSKYLKKEFASLIELTNFGIYSHCSDAFVKIDDDFIIIPVPLSKHRFKERGFNQSEFIAKVLSKKLKIPIKSFYATRVLDTEAQFTKNKVERRKNLLHAFNTLNYVKGKRFIVVDDIFTTGSTMLELSKSLYNAGAVEVRCFALSRVLLT